ncbi:MAG: T9SS type A sorting domain-containing protein [Candidatus Cloacimonetes bacterium]|nr:T9SS type A sorting domain-containing protein [Candidatus Cloacimonadota bacterium]
MYGDIDDNRLVESVDAALALMYSVGLDPIPEDPLPWEDWRQLQADVDQNGEVGAVDGAYILQYVVGIIDELPVENVYRTENYITIYNDSDYLYLSSDQKISSLHYNITDWQEITLSVADVLCPNGLYFQNENQLAMAAAEGFSGTFLRIPYLSDDLSGSSITMEIECDGFKDRVIYTFTEKVPAMTGLNAVYPNPFNPQTTIEYQLAKSGKVNIMAFNIKGQKVAVLVDEVQNAGKQAFIWDATGMNSGIYLIRLTSDSSSETCKVVLLK